MSRRNEMFGRLLKAGISSIANCEGKTAPVIEEELGAKSGVSSSTIQRYKAGFLPPDPRTVEILAEACVERGLLGRAWLERFLHVAHVPAPERLIGRLCPVVPVQQRPQRVYENLPAPSYSHFVMRTDAFADVLDGLKQRSAVVLVVGLGGTGKTSLARELAMYCLADQGAPHQFEAIVWVSDKDHPGTTNLSNVLDEIARTLDYPGFLQFMYEEKRREVEQLLKRRKVLLVVDNFETITDGALLTWLLRLPEPSKALVTSREKHRALWGSWLVELRGMSEHEAEVLINQRLRALRLNVPTDSASLFAPLIAATGGNPKALEIALGLIKHEHRIMQQVVDDLYVARGDLFDDLFNRSWRLLDEMSRRVVLAMTFFPSTASSRALQAVADAPTFAFDRSVERLSDLALLDVHHADVMSPPRFALHPLVRAFIRARLAEYPESVASARDRWVRWYCQVAAEVGFCWDNLQRLELLDAEHETLQAVIHWTFEHQCYAETIQLIEGIRYYYNVRGLWDGRLTINLLRAESARRLGDRMNETLALAHHVAILSKQGNLDEAQQYVAHLHDTIQVTDLPDEVVFERQHALALYARAHNDLATAQQYWRQLLELSTLLGGQKLVVNRRWLATCLFEQGKLDEARQLYVESLDDALRIGDQRSISGNTIKLAAIDLVQGNIERAEELLRACNTTAEQHHDWRRMGETQRLLARVHILRNDRSAARGALGIAMDLFERMGMRREFAETQAALNALATE
ncbi:MAG: NB-ARC domain-containing protein [Chloroflexota bacterium]|nr:NB-ARC domain-containing protein [Chloroflexota bacterium]